MRCKVFVKAKVFPENDRCELARGICPLTDYKVTCPLECYRRHKQIAERELERMEIDEKIREKFKLKDW